MNRARIRSLAALATLAAFAWIGLRELSPPSPLEKDAPADRFSAGRAMDVVRDVAARPHPVGSVDHDRVRDVLVERFRGLGLSAEVRTGVVFSSSRGGFAHAARAQNVVARLGGTGGPAASATHARPVMLVAHYDSVPTGPGAGDDASGVATLLETARALSALPRLPCDVIFLVTDGEEIDLFGARVAVADRALLAEDPIVLNFEARGHRGPSVMFETSGGNSELIAAYAAAARDPMANSLTFDVYQRLPNDTDFTIFRHAALEGLNFAFIGGLSHYHTALDAPDALDAGSLQQDGDAALAITRRLAAAPIEPRAADDRTNAIYFSVARAFVVHYPAAWCWPLALGAFALLATALVVGMAHGRASWVRVGRGIGAQLVSIGSAASVAYFVAQFVCPDPAADAADRVALLHDGGEFMLGVLLVAVGVHCAIGSMFGEATRVDATWTGGLCVAAGLLCFVAKLLPGGSYAFTWPVVFGSLGLLLRHLRRDRFAARPAGFALEALLVLPASLLLLALPWHLFEALTLSKAPAVAALFAVALGLHAPLLAHAASAARRLVPVAAGGAGVLVLAHATWNRGVDEHRPLQDNLFYACDSDLGTASFASFDAEPDEWTAQFLRGEAERRSLRDFLPFLGDRELLVADAEWLPIPPAVVTVTPAAATASGSLLRAVRVRVVPGAGTRRICIEAAGGRAARLTRLDGVDAPFRSGGGVLYEGPPVDGFDAEFEIEGDDPISFAVVAFRDGLPELGGAPPRRPAWIIPTPNLPDSTLVRVVARG